MCIILQLTVKYILLGEKTSGEAESCYLKVITHRFESTLKVLNDWRRRTQHTHTQMSIR